MVPHILFHDNDTTYFPNHTTWKCGKNIPSSGITQPPVIASILKIILGNQQINEGQNNRVVQIIKKIKKYHDWFIKFRDPNKTGLISILHPWESGYDNSPIWDVPMSNINVDKELHYQRRDLEVSSSDERPLKKDYDRYITIRDQFREVNYDPNKLYNISVFNVVDVGFNSLFLKALKDIDFLLRCIDKRNSSIKKYILLNESKLVKLFNSKKMTFKNKDIRNNSLVAIPSITNFFMLFADLNNNLINRGLIKSLKRYYKDELSLIHI